jgi:E3 ubiquitin-protein ligase RNF103
MWWKLVLLTIYLAVLFILSRILEAVTYYQGGYLASRLLDPVSLSVRKLKALLDQRGVSYTGVIERGEITDLVQKSGDVMDGELETATLAMAEDGMSVGAISTNFTCGSHFYEEVEDTKDSVWVVQVVRNRHQVFITQRDWKAFIKKVSRFGVQTGVFDCSFDQSLCDKKNWYKPQLILAMPRGYRAKDHVIIKSYSGSSQPQAVFDWVSANLASRVSRISVPDELVNDWYQFKSGRRKAERVRVVLFSSLKIPPLFFSVLSVKFTGRVKFGAFRVGNGGAEGSRELMDRLNLSKIPTYQVLTPEEIKTFGSGAGEYLSYQSMGLLLRTLHPEVNDIFLLSLIIVNMACSLEFFVTRGSLLKRLGRALWSIVKWNFLLILLWLPVLGLFQLPYVDTVFEYTLTALRLVGTTRFASFVRADWLWYSSVGGWLFLITTFILFASVVGWLHHVYRRPEPEPVTGGVTANDHSITGLWSIVNWESYLSSVFQPASTMPSSMAWPHLANYGSNEVSMELLIERLAVPNLWLQPVISSQYIHSLPVWKFTGPCRADSDVGSDGECATAAATSSVAVDNQDVACGGTAVDAMIPSSSLSSDAAWHHYGPRPLMFVCERCRALQSSIHAAARSEQELERERLESESACAKYLMDGNYKCMCGGGVQDSGGGASTGHQQLCRTRSPQKDNAAAADTSCSTKSSKRGTVDDGGMPGMPPGIIPTSDCSICLESYKDAALLCGLPCGHSFHQQCILGWLGRDNHCCPICRWPAYKAKPCNIHQHFE